MATETIQKNDKGGIVDAYSVTEGKRILFDSCRNIKPETKNIVTLVETPIEGGPTLFEVFYRGNQYGNNAESFYLGNDRKVANYVFHAVMKFHQVTR